MSDTKHTFSTGLKHSGSLELACDVPEQIGFAIAESDAYKLPIMVFSEDDLRAMHTLIGDLLQALEMDRIANLSGKVLVGRTVFLKDKLTITYSGMAGYELVAGSSLKVVQYAGKGDRPYNCKAVHAISLWLSRDQFLLPEEM